MSAGSLVVSLIFIGGNTVPCTSHALPVRELRGKSVSSRLLITLSSQSIGRLLSCHKVQSSGDSAQCDELSWGSVRG